MFDLKRQLGFRAGANQRERDRSRRRILRHINVQLEAASLPSAATSADRETLDITDALVANYREKTRLLLDKRAPIDARIEAFLRDHFSELNLAEPLRLPGRILELDRHGMARELSLPVDGDHYKNELVSSYRVKNGVLHNPRHDRRTTAGTFHVTAGGLPVAGDKREVPKAVFARLFRIAVDPATEYLRLPFTSQRPDQAEIFVSLHIRPLVCPAVPGVTPHKSMEIRFFAPGGLVSNLDFVESIFGNAGDPLIPEHNAALDVMHWSGHTGCVILAPQMLYCTKKDLGLPHYDQATPRQRRDSMCWRDPEEYYNDGQPFKLTCRAAEGVIVTLIADNYFGYCKKEVKTQISYAANLYGNVEEEHAGGAVAYASYNLGEKFQFNSVKYNGRTFDDVARDYGEFIDVQPEGYGIDRNFGDLVYIPENARATLRGQRIRWQRDGESHEIPLLPGKVYMSPSGYKLRMEKHPEAPSWRLVGEAAEGVFCHKPCTVSGGGKSEISKSLLDYMHYGPFFVADLESDFDYVEELLQHDFSHRWQDPSRHIPGSASRPVLGARRSLGSVIKLFTPSQDYTEEYNNFLRSIPNHIYALLLIIKRFEEPGWEKHWRDHFGVDIINGDPGHELKFRDRKLMGSYLRVGFLGTHQWRTFKLRQDFIASRKVQREDDISVSMVVPAAQVAYHGNPEGTQAVKIVENCEYRFFQRPDEAIHRGFDKQAEADLAGLDNFISNFEPLTQEAVQRMAQYVADFDAFSPPMQELLKSMLESDESYVVCSANPRQIDGKPSKNPRYLQNRPGLVDPMTPYVAERGLRLWRALPIGQDAPVPVHGVLMGRRNNPPEPAKGIRMLAVYGPIHYQELPELFMDLICSLTGKSPSTTGFGSEGALTKGPFNALRPAADLNTALVSYILTGLAGYSTAAGHVGPDVQVDHDISLLIPEIWCRLFPEERDPRRLIAEGCLEKLDDVDLQGEVVQVSRLGYRITQRFMQRYCGRIFDSPGKVFDEEILKPELQDRQAFYDGVRYISDAHKRGALQYFEDGTIEVMCPPLAALLSIMAYGKFEGKEITHPDIRGMFTREYLLDSSWYRDRLITKQHRDIALWQRHIDSLDAFTRQSSNSAEVQRLRLADRRDQAVAQLNRVSNPEYLGQLVGLLGAEPMGR